MSEFAFGPDDGAAESTQQKEPKVKLLVVGDGAVGKTCFFIRVATGTFPQEYVPTVFDNYETKCNGAVVGLWDTASREDYDRLLPLSFPGTDLALFAASCIHPTSLQRLRDLHIPNVLDHVPTVRGALLITKTDLRDDPDMIAKLKARGEKPLTHEECAAFAKEHGLALFEVSAKTGDNVDAAFALMVELAVEDKTARMTAAKSRGFGRRLASLFKGMFGEKK